VNETVLDVSDLTVRRGGREVLHAVSLTVRRGQAVAVLGPNGAGKTTLLRTISGLHRHSGGTVSILGAPVGQSPRAIVRRGLSHIPQGREVFPRATVRENLELGGYTLPRSLRRQRLADVYEIFPQLAALHRRRAGLLSGGEQQMLAIGRALIARPEILTLDEPSMGLAPRIVEEVGNVIDAVHATGTTILLVEQQLGLALRLCDYAYILVNGMISAHGPVDQFRSGPALADAYLSGGAGALAG